MNPLEPKDKQTRDGLTIGLRYEKVRHMTVFTVRCNGKVLEVVRMRGNYLENEHGTRRIIAEIKAVHKKDCEK